MEWMYQAFTCAEITNPEIRAPRNLLRLLEDPDNHISNDHEALLSLLHILMLELGFLPCTTESLWHKTHYYSISYTHYSTGDITSHLKYLPLGCSAIIFATVGTKEVAKEHIDPGLYVKDHTKKKPFDIYKGIPDLSRTFKDNVGRNLLYGAQECANVNYTFGFHTLATEMKLEVLYRMDVTALVALSVANQEFRQLIEHPSTAVWQQVLYRDFPKYLNKTEGDWKVLYQAEYKAKKHAEKLERDKLKKEQENLERRQRIRGYQEFEEFRRHGPFATHFGLPQRFFGLPQEPRRRQDLASVNFRVF